MKETIQVLVRVFVVKMISTLAMLQELCEDREAAKRKISQLKIYPKTRTINLDHDYQASSGAGANSRYNRYI